MNHPSRIDVWFATCFVVFLVLLILYGAYGGHS